MYTGAAGHYLRVGLSAISCIDAAGVRDPGAILDLPCGHGRVLRALKAAFPRAELTASDIDREGVDFCAERFGARPIYSSAELDHVDLPGGFDLVWCGSLATHLDRDDTIALLEKLAGSLAPGGSLAVTTHGQSVAERLERGEAHYQLDEDGVARVVSGYRGDGFGYAGYPGSPGYGISVIAPDWLRAHAPLPVTHFAERGWDGHQDVHVLRRPAGD